MVAKLGFTNTKTEFASPFYPIPCEDSNLPVKFYFQSLNLIEPKEFDSVIKIDDFEKCNNYELQRRGFDIFRKIFVKEEAGYNTMLLSYNTKDQTKLNIFNVAEYTRTRDRKFRKEAKSVNFIAGCWVDNPSGEIMVLNLPLDSVLKQIKSKTMVGKIYVSKKYEAYIEMLNEKYKENKNKIIPLQECKLLNEFGTSTNISQLAAYLIPECKPHKLGEFIHLLKNNMSVKDFKNSKNYGRILELKGEPIRYFYNEKNYTKLAKDGGSVLYNSCMRHNSCYEQLKFYSNNPSSISLLVVMDRENPKQISARTILWTGIDGTKAIDRIYCNNQDDLNIVITYCKAVRYQTIYSGNSDSYGLQLNKNFIVHIENPEDTGLPYFDTMRVFEKLNNFLSRDYSPIKEYCIKNKLNYSIVRPGDWMTEAIIEFSIKGSSKKEVISDINNNEIQDWRKIIAIDLPKIGYLKGDQIDIIGYPKRKIFRSAKIFINRLKERYNCIIKAKYRIAPNKYEEYLDDKANVVYSTILKSYIDRKDSYFNYNLNSYIYKESVNDTEIRNIYKVKKLRQVFNNKSVRVSTEGYEYFKELNEGLTIPLNIIKIRPSRKFKIQAKNIKLNGVLLNNILIPFRYLKIIKHNGENKE